MKDLDIKINEVVTVKLEKETVSNTFVVDSILNEDCVLLKHPLAPKIFIKEYKDHLNNAPPTVKGSQDRALYFLNNNRDLLDYNGKRDLDALCMFFVVTRDLTPKQKKILADLSGKVANIKFDGNVKKAMSYVKTNEAVLDDFNRMWYNNFYKLFNGRQEISSTKQSNAIFNITGFILSEMESNETTNNLVVGKL